MANNLLWFVYSFHDGSSEYLKKFKNLALSVFGSSSKEMLR